MEKLPYSLFMLPRKGTQERRELSFFLDAKSNELSIFLSWLSAEILVKEGADNLLELIENEGSKRISLARLYQYIKIRPETKKIIQQNNNYAEFIDVQSVSGFIESIRKYTVVSLMRSQRPSVEIVKYTGVSIRTIQRISSVQKNRA